MVPRLRDGGVKRPRVHLWYNTDWVYDQRAKFLENNAATATGEGYCTSLT
jgi:hypothetical protein